MNREIKFRIWNAKDHWYFEENEAPDINVRGEIVDELGYYDCLVIEQYTGLKDKNGKPIYEGDILERTLQIAFSPEYSSQEIVEWRKNGSWSFCSDLFPQQAVTSLKVVGNIHENPELIKIN